MEQPLAGPEEVTHLMEELSRKNLILEHVNEMSKIRDTLFPCSDKHIKEAPNKQQQQYKKKRSQSSSPFKVGALVLQWNMLQSTKKQYKFRTNRLVHTK